MILIKYQKEGLAVRKKDWCKQKKESLYFYNLVIEMKKRELYEKYNDALRSCMYKNLIFAGKNIIFGSNYILIIHDLFTVHY